MVSGKPTPATREIGEGTIFVKLATQNKAYYRSYI